MLCIEIFSRMEEMYVRTYVKGDIHAYLSGAEAEAKKSRVKGLVHKAALPDSLKVCKQN